MAARWLDVPKYQPLNSDKHTVNRPLLSPAPFTAALQSLESKEPEPMSEVVPIRARTPRDDVWDSLTAHFGQPRTKTERSMFGRVVAELLEAGATQAETTKACEYVIATFDSPSVNAVPKWFSVAQNAGTKKSAQQLEIDRLRQL